MKNITKADIDNLLGIPVTPHGIFHNKTKLKNFPKLPSKIRKLSEKNYPRVFKDYPRLEKIFLTGPDGLSDYSLESALQNRISSRVFSRKQLSMDVLSTLLYFSGGIKTGKNESGSFYPSAGGKYPLEIYFLSLNCELPKGLYHYSVKNHLFEVLRKTRKIPIANFFKQDWINKAGGIIIVTAVFDRTTRKYGERGYRSVLQEVGYLGQLIYLLSGVLKIGCCAVGGFIDDKINDYLDVDGANESVVGVFPVGCI